MSIGSPRTEILIKPPNHIAKSVERKSGSYQRKLTRVGNLAGLPTVDFDTVLQVTEVAKSGALVGVLPGSCATRAW